MPFQGSRNDLNSDLFSYSTPISFACGTGFSIFQDVLLPAILSAEEEIVLATCFWANSKTRDELVKTLQLLSAQVTKANGLNKVQVYICFSSSSAAQKLFHTSSPDGHIYPSKDWNRKLGLPAPDEVPGLDISVKSLFFRPFSVLHSKYLIIDRSEVYFPSCNVSWEDWYECCIGFRGPIVKQVFEFWRDVWRPAKLVDHLTEQHCHEAHLADKYGGNFESYQISFDGRPLRTTLLRHPHDSSLRQSLFFLPASNAPLPQTPLNTTLLRLITGAKHEIVLLTPNLTSDIAITALCHALKNGINVMLITNRRMMVPEQVVTAGIVTEQVVDKLIKAHGRGFEGRRMKKRFARLAESLFEQKLHFDEHDGQNDQSILQRVGRLQVSYFRRPDGVGTQTAERELAFGAICDKSHIKLTMVDGRAMVLGSGNMDRASWRTSQELGVLVEDEIETIHSTDTVMKIWRQVEQGLEGCLEHYFDSGR